MTPPIHVGLAQHPIKRVRGAVSHSGNSTEDIVCLLLFVYNMSNMSLYCMSCIICLNEVYFICVLARKPGNISRGLWSS